MSYCADRPATFPGSAGRTAAERRYLAALEACGQAYDAIRRLEATWRFDHGMRYQEWMDAQARFKGAICELTFARKALVPPEQKRPDAQTERYLAELNPAWDEDGA